MVAKRYKNSYWDYGKTRRPTLLVTPSSFHIGITCNFRTHSSILRAGLTACFLYLEHPGSLALRAVRVCNPPCEPVTWVHGSGGWIRTTDIRFQRATLLPLNYSRISSPNSELNGAIKLTKFACRTAITFGACIYLALLVPILLNLQLAGLLAARKPTVPNFLIYYHPLPRSCDVRSRF